MLGILLGVSLCQQNDKIMTQIPQQNENYTFCNAKSSFNGNNARVKYTTYVNGDFAAVTLEIDDLTRPVQIDARDWKRLVNAGVYIKCNN